MKYDEKRIKVAIISGASHAIRYKEKHPRATEEEVIQHISKKAGEIMDKIDEDL